MNHYIYKIRDRRRFEMYRILLATDGSEHSTRVVEEALLVAEALNAEVTILNVVRESVFSPRVGAHVSDDSWKLIVKQLKEEAEEIVEKAAELFRKKGLTVDTKVAFGHQAPADVICETAEKGKYNLVILGSRGLRGIKEAFLGSVSNKVAHHAGINVLIVK
jgi:nucleotide-binding universal stress UspA family protein